MSTLLSPEASPAAPRAAGDLVHDEGITYVALKDVPPGAPLADRRAFAPLPGAEAPVHRVPRIAFVTETAVAPGGTIHLAGEGLSQAGNAVVLRSRATGGETTCPVVERIYGYCVRARLPLGLAPDVYDVRVDGALGRSDLYRGEFDHDPALTYPGVTVVAAFPDPTGLGLGWAESIGRMIAGRIKGVDGMGHPVETALRVDVKTGRINGTTTQVDNFPAIGPTTYVATANAPFGGTPGQEMAGALQACIDYVSSHGGGVVEIPADTQHDGVDTWLLRDQGSAKFSVTVTSGVITNVTVTNAGSGYKANSQIYLTIYDTALGSAWDAAHTRPSGFNKATVRVTTDGSGSILSTPIYIDYSGAGYSSTATTHAVALQPLTLKPNVVIRGQGKGRTVLRFGIQDDAIGTADAVWDADTDGKASNATMSPIVLDGCDDCGLVGLSLENWTGGAYAVPSLFNPQGDACHRVVLQDVEILGRRSRLWWGTGTIARLAMVDCVLSDTLQGYRPHTRTAGQNENALQGSAWSSRLLPTVGDGLVLRDSAFLFATGRLFVNGVRHALLDGVRVRRDASAEAYVESGIVEVSRCDQLLALRGRMEQFGVPRNLNSGEGIGSQVSDTAGYGTVATVESVAGGGNGVVLRQGLCPNGAMTDGQTTGLWSLNASAKPAVWLVCLSGPGAGQARRVAARTKSGTDYLTSSGAGWRIRSVAMRGAAAGGAVDPSKGGGAIALLASGGAPSRVPALRGDVTDGGEVRYAQVDDGGLYPDGSATVTVSETGTSGVLGTAALSSLDTVWLDPGSAWDAGPGSVVALVAQPAWQQFFLGCEAFGGLSGLDFYSGCVDCVVAGLATQDAWQSRARCSDERYGGEVRSFYRVDGLTLDGCAFATSGARPAGFDVQAVAGYGGGGLARTAAGAPLPLVRNLRVVNCEVSGPPRWLSTAQGGTYRQESGLHAVEFYEGTQALGPDGVPRGLYLGEGIVARGNLADGAPLALRYGYAASQDALEREYPSPAPEG